MEQKNFDKDKLEQFESSLKVAPNRRLVRKGQFVALKKMGNKKKMEELQNIPDDTLRFKWVDSETI